MSHEERWRRFVWSDEDGGGITWVKAIPEKGNEMKNLTAEQRRLSSEGAEFLVLGNY
jgi:hypothetical protein